MELRLTAVNRVIEVVYSQLSGCVFYWLRDLLGLSLDFRSLPK